MRRYFKKKDRSTGKSKELAGLDPSLKESAFSRISEMPALQEMSATQILQAYSEALNDLRDS